MPGEVLVDYLGPQREPAGEVLGAQRKERAQLGADGQRVAPVEPGTKQHRVPEVAPAGQVARSARLGAAAGEPLI